MNEPVPAEIPGSIIAVLVEPGQRVAVGDTLMMMESMKLEVPVTTEFSGTIARLWVAVGDVVMEGDELAVIDR